jgi:hypothetical protein
MTDHLADELAVALLDMRFVVLAIGTGPGGEQAMALSVTVS